MSEFTPDTEQSLESDQLHLGFALFQAEYCDPDRPVLDTYKGQIIRYSAIHFHDQIDDRTIVLRSGMYSNKPENKIEQVFWMATFDYPTSKTTTYEVVESEKQVIEPFLQRTGGYEIVHTAKSRDEKAQTVQFRMSSRVLEWTTIV